MWDEVKEAVEVCEELHLLHCCSLAFGLLPAFFFFLVDFKDFLPGFFFF